MTHLPVLSCENCGACCDRQGTPPMLWEEFVALPGHLRWDRDAHAARYDQGLPCIWFDTDKKSCKHYEYRPKTCREFRLGGPTCRAFRQEKGLLVWPPELDVEED